MSISGCSALPKSLESIYLPSVIQKKYSFYGLSLLHGMNQHMWRQLGNFLQKHTPHLAYNAVYVLIPSHCGRLTGMFLRLALLCCRLEVMPPEYLRWTACPSPQAYEV